VLGRTGEEPGALTSTLRVERDGRALHHQTLEVDDRASWRSSAVIGDARVVRTILTVGQRAPQPATAPVTTGDAASAVSMALADDAVLLQALGPDTVAVKELVELMLSDGAATEPGGAPGAHRAATSIGNAKWYGSRTDADGKTARQQDQYSDMMSTRGGAGG